MFPGSHSDIGVAELTSDVLRDVRGGVSSVTESDSIGKLADRNAEEVVDVEMEEAVEGVETLCEDCCCSGSRVGKRDGGSLSHLEETVSVGLVRGDSRMVDVLPSPEGIKLAELPDPIRRWVALLLLLVALER